MGEAFQRINEQLLDIHTEIVSRTNVLHAIQDPSNIPDIVKFVKTIYHDTYDVWRATTLSYEYYYNILCSLEKYVYAISFRSLLLVKEEDYEDLWCVLDDLIIFLEEEYDYFDIFSILTDLETAADVFSAALVVPTNNIYTRLVELRQVLNMVYKDNPNLEEDFMFSLNMNGYFEMKTVSWNKAIIKVLTYSQYTDDDEGRRLFFAIPAMDPEEPEFDDAVAELGGVYDHGIVKRMLQSRGGSLERDTRLFVDNVADLIANDQILNFNMILQFITASLFTLLLFLFLPNEEVVSNLLELLKLLPLQDLLTIGDELGVQECLLHIIYLTNELRLENLGIDCIDTMFNYAELLRLMKLRVQFPDADATTQDEHHYVTRDRDPMSPAIMLAAFGTIDVQKYNTLNELVVSLGRRYCSLCKSNHFGEDFGLCVNCPHLLCFTCLPYWINKSATFTCPVCRELMPKLYFGHEFMDLKGILASGGRHSAKIAREFYRTLKRLI